MENDYDYDYDYDYGDDFDDHDKDIYHEYDNFYSNTGLYLIYILFF